MVIRKETKPRKARNRILLTITGIQTLLLTAASSFADAISEAAEGAANDAVLSMQNLGKPALMVVVGACGLIFIIGTQRQKDNWKDGLLIKVVGVGILVMAVPIADLVFGWFS